MPSEHFGNPVVRLRGNHENSQFWHIVANILCYYSLILGPTAIRMFREPRGPFTWNSSKHAILAYSGEFSKLLVTDFGSRCDLNYLGTPGSDYAELVSRSFGLFLPLLYAITH